MSRRLRRALKMFCHFLPAPTKKRLANAKDTKHATSWGSALQAHRRKCLKRRAPFHALLISGSKVRALEDWFAPARLIGNMQRAIGAAGHSLARNLLKGWTCCDAFVISRSRVQLPPPAPANSGSSDAPVPPKTEFATTRVRRRVVEAIEGGLVAHREPAVVGVDGELDARMAELALHVAGALALLEQERGEGVAQAVRPPSGCA